MYLAKAQSFSAREEALDIFNGVCLPSDRERV